jgi:hypothetical protein
MRPAHDLRTDGQRANVAGSGLATLVLLIVGRPGEWSASIPIVLRDRGLGK